MKRGCLQVPSAVPEAGLELGWVLLVCDNRRRGECKQEFRASCQRRLGKALKWGEIIARVEIS